MKKLLSAIVLALALSAPAFSQVSVEINDSFYKNAMNWELRGLTTTLPQLRPYPLSVVERVLNDVIENGSERDSELAKSEYERIFSKKFHPYGKGGATVKVSSNSKSESDDDTTKNLGGEAGIGGDVRLHNIVSVAYKFGIYGESADFGDYSPYFTNILEDSIFDPVSVGPFELFLNWNMNVAVGNSKVYGTFGMSRVGFGPFYGEGLALNDIGYHSANLIFNATAGNWSYASTYETIGATRNIPDVDGSWLDGGKYLAFHAIKWHKFSKFNLTYYENIVFGPRTNISYIFPAPYYAVTNIGGANDNLQMGLLFEIKPFKGFNWATDFFADDIELNEVLKFNFDTKLRFGFQTGVVYAPEDSVLSQISLTYTAVMPFVYAHWQYENSSTGAFNGYTWNYQNYTNAGINIGSTLDPNSDKINLNARFSPSKNLSLNANVSFTRHSNSAEDFSYDEAAEYVLAKANTYSTNGTASMSQMFSNPDDTHGKHVDSAWEKLGFMTSSHKQFIAQTGLEAEYTFARTKYGQFSLKAGYVFEYVKNAGVNRNVYNGGLEWQKTDGGKFEAGGTEYEDWNALKESDYVKTAVLAAKQKWISNLYDCTNHYLSFSVKYSY